MNSRTPIMIKFCGIRTKQDIDKCQYANYLGFIVDVPNAKRSLNHDEAKGLIEYGKRYSKTVAVTNFEERILKINRLVSPDIIQIHANIVQNLDTLQNELKSIKQNYALVIGLEENKIVNERVLNHSLGIHAEYIVIEQSSNGKIGGGLGKSRDWSETKEIIQKYPHLRFFVAGGINTHNALNVINITNPSGIDISSGIENPDGSKSTVIIKKIFKQLKNRMKVI